MMLKFTVVIITLFLAMTGISAGKIRGLQDEPRELMGPGGHKNGFGGPKVDLSPCPDVSEPDCALRNGELGTWLCRTIVVDPLTGDTESWSTCGKETRALSVDACGCCGGMCPVACTCLCPLQGVADAGVLVTRTGPSGQENEKCLTPENAMSRVAKPGGRFQCVTECPVTDP
jgi:hypothetical protein